MILNWYWYSLQGGTNVSACPNTKLDPELVLVQSSGGTNVSACPNTRLDPELVLVQSSGGTNVSACPNTRLDPVPLKFSQHPDILFF
jgi:hypothetical protein